MKNKTARLCIPLFLIICFGPGCGGEAPEKAKHPAKERVKQERSSPYDTFQQPLYQSVASFLAGKLPEHQHGPLQKQFESPVWKSYHEDFSVQWKNYQKEVLQDVSLWAQDHLTYSDTIYYPFSGPDFNYLHALFPDAGSALLIGLEQPGSLPAIATMDQTVLEEYLYELRKSLYFNLKYSFFRTKSMEKELNSEVLDGTVPLILLFMAGHGFEVINLYPVSISEEGLFYADTAQVIFGPHPNTEFEDAVAFVYRKPGETTLRQLFYLHHDISDNGLKQQRYRRLLSNFAQDNTTFLKAASYLCFKPYFSVVRTQILENSKEVVTDPSGIPFKDFTSDKWEVKVYGNYTGPIKLFEDYMQEDLMEFCQEQGDKSLPFRMGYHPSQRCLIVASRK